MRNKRDFPTLRQLRAFEAVAVVNSFGAAARELGLSQPAVTQMVAHMESALLSTLEAQFADPEALTTVPFQSPELTRVDGVATRADWQPTRLHQQFLDLLRGEAREYQESRASSRAVEGAPVVHPRIKPTADTLVRTSSTASTPGHQ